MKYIKQFLNNDCMVWVGLAYMFGVLTMFICIELAIKF